MSSWYFDSRELKNTPSFRDGIDYETETRYRREGARFIIDVGADLNLRYDTVATGCVYFHRFFMLHSFKEFNKYVTALGCLFLAGKVEETPKKCKDLLRVSRLRLSDEKFAPFGEDPKEEVMATERVLLQTIKFDLQLEHPYQFLIKYAKILKGSKDKAGIENMVQMAWTFINDSLCTMICLQWEPEIVAIALMYLASRLGKCTITDWGGKKGVENEKWWDQFVEDLNVDVLEDICHQVLDLYSPTQNSTSGPTDKAQSVSSVSSKGSAGNTPSSISALSTTKVSPSTPTSIATARIETPSKIHSVVGIHSTVVGSVHKATPPLTMPTNQPPPPAVHQIMPAYVHGPVPGYAYQVPMPSSQSLQRPPVYAYPPPNMAAPPPASAPPFTYYAPPPQPYSVPPPARPLHAEYSPRTLPPGVHPGQLYSPQRVLRPPLAKPGGRY